jgi:hypothetical protein
MGTLVFLIFTLLSCTTIDPSTSILEALQESPEKGIAMAMAIEDPLQRTMIITELVQSYPNRSRPLCDALPTSISKERCIRLNERPHLWKPQKDNLKLNPKPITARQSNCNIAPHPITCRSAEAQIFAQQRQSELAMQSCAAIKETMWQAECFFTISEEFSNHSDFYTESIEACDHSKQFAKSCWHHSVMGLASSSEKHPNDWDWHRSMINQITTLWESRDPSMSLELQSHFWAQSIQRQTESGQLQSEKLPKEAIQHYRSSMAINALRFSSKSLQNLEEWAQIAQNGFTERKKRARGFLPEMDLWLPQDAPEGAVKTSYLGNSHRWTHSDPDIDWILAVLEASARLRPLNKVLIMEGQAHQHPTVKATANRLASLDLLAPPDKQIGRK